MIRIAQGLLAAVLVMAGSMKLAQPKERLAASGQAWVEDFDAQQVKGIGVLEVLAAIGLVLPAALDLVPALLGLRGLASGLGRALRDLAQGRDKGAQWRRCVGVTHIERSAGRWRLAHSRAATPQTRRARMT